MRENREVMVFYVRSFTLCWASGPVPATTQAFACGCAAQGWAASAAGDSCRCVGHASTRQGVMRPWPSR